MDIPDFGLLGHFSLLGSFSKIGIVSACLLIFTLMLADFFDTMGTMVAIGAEAGLLDEEGNPPNAQRILIVDSVAAAAGGAASVSSNTSYIESASGVGEGARTGLASVVTGVLFLLATFLSPLVSVVPYEAATPALVIVGFLMMQQVRGISWDDLEIAIPAFLTIVLMPFTYSITVGIGAGLRGLHADQGRPRQVRRRPPAPLGRVRRCSSSTSRSSRSSSCSASADPRRASGPAVGVLRPSPCRWFADRTAGARRSGG